MNLDEQIEAARAAYAKVKYKKRNADGEFPADKLSAQKCLDDLLKLQRNSRSPTIEQEAANVEFPKDNVHLNMNADKHATEVPNGGLKNTSEEMDGISTFAGKETVPQINLADQNAIPPERFEEWVRLENPHNEAPEKAGNEMEVDVDIVSGQARLNILNQDVYAIEKLEKARHHSEGIDMEMETTKHGQVIHGDLNGAAMDVDVDNIPKEINMNDEGATTDVEKVPSNGLVNEKDAHADINVVGAPVEIEIDVQADPDSSQGSASSDHPAAEGKEVVECDIEMKPIKSGQESTDSSQGSASSDHPAAEGKEVVERDIEMKPIKSGPDSTGESGDGLRMTDLPDDWDELLSFSPQIAFTMPTTPEAFLAYEFSYVPVDWDDPSIPTAPRFENEPRHNGDARTHLYTKKYDLADAERQREDLLSVYQAADKLFEEGILRGKAGAKTVENLKASLLNMNDLVAQKRIAAQDSQKDYDRHFTLYSSIQRENLLRKEVSEMLKALETIDATEFGDFRAKLLVKKRDLQVLSERNEEEKANTEGNKVHAAKKAKDEDEDDPAENRARYYRLDENRRELLSERGRALISNFCKASTPLARSRALEKIGVGIRKASRDVQEFLPESAYKSVEVAKIVHYTSSKNYLCRYHQHNRGHAQHDRVGELTGVAYRKALSSKAGGVVVPKSGHMNCGCAVDDVLVEFFIWKTFQAFSTNPKLAGHKHYMSDNDIVPAKTRRFWVQHWMDVTCLTVNDIYGDDSDSGGWIPRLAAISIVRQIERLNVLGFKLQLSSSAGEGERDFGEFIGGDGDM